MKTLQQGVTSSVKLRRTLVLFSALGSWVTLPHNSIMLGWELWMNVHVRKSYHAPDMWKKQSLMNQGKKLVTRYFGQMFQHDKTMFDDCLPGFFKRLSLSTKTGPLKKYFEWEWAPEKNNGPTASELALVSTRTCLWKRSIRFSSISTWKEKLTNT